MTPPTVMQYRHKEPLIGRINMLYTSIYSVGNISVLSQHIINYKITTLINEYPLNEIIELRNWCMNSGSNAVKYYGDVADICSKIIRESNLNTILE